MKILSEDIIAGILKNTLAIHELMCNDKDYKLLKKVRGLPTCWQQLLYNTLAMMHYIGIPTWWYTLSEAEFHWSDTLQAIGIQFGKHFKDEKY